MDFSRLDQSDNKEVDGINEQPDKKESIHKTLGNIKDLFLDQLSDANSKITDTWESTKENLKSFERERRIRKLFEEAGIPYLPSGGVIVPDVKFSPAFDDLSPEEVVEMRLKLDKQMKEVVLKTRESSDAPIVHATDLTRDTDESISPNPIDENLWIDDLNEDMALHMSEVVRTSDEILNKMFMSTDRPVNELAYGDFTPLLDSFRTVTVPLEDVIAGTANIESTKILGIFADQLEKAEPEVKIELAKNPLKAFDTIIDNHIRPEVSQLINEKCNVIIQSDTFEGVSEGIADKAQIVKEAAEKATDLTVNTAKNAAYLLARTGVGTLGVVEDTADFVVSAGTTAVGKSELAKQVYDYSLTEKIDESLNKHFKPSERVEYAGDFTEKGGEMATYMALAIVGTGQLHAINGVFNIGKMGQVAALAASGLGQGSIAVEDSYNKTGEVGTKEIAYGAVVGTINVAADLAAGAVIDKAGILANSSKNIIGKAAELAGKNPVLSKSYKALSAGVQGAFTGGFTEANLQAVKEIQEQLGWNVDEGGDAMDVVKAAGMGAACGVAFWAAGEIVKALKPEGKVKNKVDEVDDVSHEKVEEAGLEKVDELDEGKNVIDIAQGEIDRLQNKVIEKVKNGTITLETNMEKGNFGEMCMDQAMKKQGFERISKDTVTSLDAPTHPGIDGVYRNAEGKYIIAEAKFGSAKLENTQHGKQMSKAWIEKNLDAAVGPEWADEIREVLLRDPDSVIMCVSRVDAIGSVLFELLNDSTEVLSKGLETLL